MYDVIGVKNKVLDFVKRNGPVLPVQISREIKENSILAGAVLSELIRNKQLLVSHAKIGGSPVYYVSEQKPKLEMLYKHLGQKHREIFDLLKKERVMKDSWMEPWQRVAIREIEDFSVKLTLSSNGDVYWKWYALQNSDAEQVIKEKFSNIPEVMAETTEVIKVPEQIKAVEVKTADMKLPEFSEITVNPKEKIELVKEKKSRVKKEKPVIVNEKPLVVDDEIMTGIRKWFAENDSRMIEEIVIRKNKDMEGVVTIKSNLGEVHMFMKFKDKKRISDAELSLAQAKARTRNLSLIFLSTGELTKKAQGYADKNHILYRSVKL